METARNFADFRSVLWSLPCPLPPCGNWKTETARNRTRHTPRVRAILNKRGRKNAQNSIGHENGKFRRNVPALGHLVRHQLIPHLCERGYEYELLRPSCREIVLCVFDLSTTTEVKLITKRSSNPSFRNHILNRGLEFSEKGRWAPSGRERGGGGDVFV